MYSFLRVLTDEKTGHHEADVGVILVWGCEEPRSPGQEPAREERAFELALKLGALIHPVTKYLRSVSLVQIVS